MSDNISSKNRIANEKTLDSDLTCEADIFENTFDEAFPNPSLCKIRSEEYRLHVLVGKRVNRVAEDVLDKDQKRKFLMRGYPPTVERMEAHDVQNNLRKYLPYLVYYHEPDLTPFLSQTEEVQAMSRYINNAFKLNLEIEARPADDVHVVISDEKYDYIMTHNDEACVKAYKNMNAYERDVFVREYPLTFERLQSVDVAYNTERFLPFLLRVTEPSLHIKNKHIMGPDWELICDYVRNILYEHLDFADE